MKSRTMTVGFGVALLVMIVGALLVTGRAALARPEAFSCATATGVPQVECEALVALYNSTNGAGWTNATDWLVTNTPCSWYGVVCSGGHVTQLNLFSNNLAGPLPPELGNLASLQKLLLYSNALTGSIPEELGNLAALTDLYLNQNQLTGSIPPALGGLTALVRLYLYTNQLDGPIPGSLGGLGAVQFVNLSGNQLTGLIPPELGSLANLKQLYLNQNQLTGSIPAELGGLASLNYLYLSSNQLSGSVPSALGNLSNLTRLVLGFNQLSGTVPSDLGNLANLQELRLNNNLFSGSLPLSFTGLTNLNIFYFNNTDLCEPADPGFQSWLSGVPTKSGTGDTCTLEVSKQGAPPYGQTGGSLTYTLSLHNATASQYTSVVLTDTLPSGVTLNSSIPLMDFRDGNLLRWNVGTLAAGGTYQVTLQMTLPAAPGLLVNDSSSKGTFGTVDKDHAQFATQVFDFCGTVTQIPHSECLALVALYNATNGSAWTDNTGWLANNTPCSWFGVTCAVGQVTELDLPANGLSGGLPAEIGDFGRLQRLNLPGNALTGALPTELGNLGRLQELILHSNQLNGAIPGELGNLAALTALDLHANQLAETIPAALGQLASLESLNLSDNQLEAAIPPELGDLTSLQALDLSTNQLTGSLPPELGNLAALQTLRTAGNGIGGSLPPALGNLLNLQTLDLSDNLFSGPLASSLTGLTSLTLFHFDLTDLCEPDETAMQTWLAGIADLQSTDVLCRLSLSKDGDPANGGTGAELTYTLTARNVSTDTVYTNVVVSDTLPAGTTFVDATPPPTTQAGNDLTWDLGTLNQGDTVTIVVTVQLPAAPSTVLNQASITGDGASALLSSRPAAIEEAVASFKTRVFQRADPLVVTIDLSGNDVALSWNAASVPVWRYEVWRAADDPYFAPGSACTAPACTTTTATNITFVGDAGDPSTNYTYLVLAVNLGGRSDPSNRVGEFDFGLLPGAVAR